MLTVGARDTVLIYHHTTRWVSTATASRGATDHRLTGGEEAQLDEVLVDGRMLDLLLPEAHLNQVDRQGVVVERIDPVALTESEPKT